VSRKYVSRLFIVLGLVMFAGGSNQAVDHLFAQATPAPTYSPDGSMWDADQAMSDIATVLTFGPRALNTPGHTKIIDFIESEFSKTSAVVTTQQGLDEGLDRVQYPVTNVIARFDPSNPRRIILGTHYDSIVRAYADPTHPDDPMPGANNSASGVALLLETAHVLDSVQRPPFGIDFVFFDGEEGPKSLGAGDPAWFPLGSPYFADHLTDLYPTQKPSQGIIFDMVCDKNLDIYPETSSVISAKSEVQSFWDIGSKIAPTAFLQSPSTSSVGDDQNALDRAGIPSFLVIDFDYSPWFNTTQDTIDKCSTTSMQSVGRTLMQYLYTVSPGAK
jgi:glutaminyl-peptide cyclotransferase